MFNLNSDYNNGIYKLSLVRSVTMHVSRVPGVLLGLEKGTDWDPTPGDPTATCKKPWLLRANIANIA